MKLRPRHLVSIAVLCPVLLGVTIWALYAEYDRPWMHYGREFREIEYRLTGNPAVLSGDVKIRQLWLRQLGITDRCITCHEGADRPEFIRQARPFRTHPGDYLKKHPVERFGCVVCHEGQGPALTVEAAHGVEENWRRPLLRGGFAESSCSRCHFMDPRLPMSSELPEAAEFSYGWRLFREYNCIGCHKLSGYRRPEHIGPPLTSIGSKVNRDWLVRWLKEPRAVLPGTKMPAFRLSDEETGDIADYLMTGGGTPRPAPVLMKKGVFSDKALIKEGKGLFVSLGCTGCHAVNGRGSAFAPDLSDTGGKLRPGWLLRWLKNPRAVNPYARMPDLMLTDNEVQALSAYLMTLKRSNSGPPPSTQRASEGGGPPAKNIEEGRSLVRDLGCRGCHEIGGLGFQYIAPPLDNIGDKRTDELFFGNITGIEKDLITWLKIKVKAPGRFSTDKVAAVMPDYGFNDRQARALVTFLLGIRDRPVPPRYRKTLLDPESIEMRGRALFERYNCTGCHRLRGEGRGIAPALDREAEKSRPEWLFNFLKRPHKIRPAPILRARMPDFNLPDRDAVTLIEYLSYVAGEPFPFNPEPKRQVYAEDVRDGEKLYREVFACIACHSLNGTGGRIGPDHTDLASRLKRPWVEKWLKNPLSIKPDVRMPVFKFRDWEFEALT
ncbi:MAG: c-type cytochrome, partial [Deferribacteres bacterium]|nr:c-type cytochrome [Deferribacteres bacterium]